MSIVRTSIVGAISAVALWGGDSRLEAHCRSRLFLAPAYSAQASQSDLAETTWGDALPSAPISAGVSLATHCSWSEESSGGSTLVRDAAETEAPPLLPPAYARGSVEVAEPIGSAPYPHRWAVPAHPIYSYLAAGPYYYGVPSYYDPSWDAGRLARQSAQRGPVAKGRSDVYPALPYSEFANRQTTENANQDATRAQIVVRVPSDDARVYFEGQLMQTGGQVRTFTTPPLVRGRVYELEIRGVWQGDEPHTKRIEVRAGQTYTVELGK